MLFRSLRDASHQKPNITFQAFEQLTEPVPVEQKSPADSAGEIAVPGHRTNGGNRHIIDAGFRLADIDELKRLVVRDQHGSMCTTVPQGLKRTGHEPAGAALHVPSDTA